MFFYEHGKFFYFILPVSKGLEPVQNINKQSKGRIIISIIEKNTKPNSAKDQKKQNIKVLLKLNLNYLYNIVCILRLSLCMPIWLYSSLVSKIVFLGGLCVN